MISSSFNCHLDPPQHRTSFMILQTALWFCLLRIIFTIERKVSRPIDFYIFQVNAKTQMIIEEFRSNLYNMSLEFQEKWKEKSMLADTACHDHVLLHSHYLFNLVCHMSLYMFTLWCLECEWVRISFVPVFVCTCAYCFSYYCVLISDLWLCVSVQ